MAAKGISIPALLRLPLVILVGAVLVDFGIFFTLPLSLLFPAPHDSGGVPPETAAVLFNDFNRDFTGINDETRRRLNHGIVLLEKDRIKKLIVVGGNREKSGRKGSLLMADYLLAQGIPPEKIIVEADSKDTVSNLEQLGKILSEYNTNLLGLISSPHHLFRVQALHLPLSFEVRYFSYNPADCLPPLSRSEVWFSAHYNAAAYLARILLPETLYGKLVLWVRQNTDW